MISAARVGRSGLAGPARARNSWRHCAAARRQSRSPGRAGNDIRPIDIAEPAERLGCAPMSGPTRCCVLPGSMRRSGLPSKTHLIWSRPTQRVRGAEIRGPEGRRRAGAVPLDHVAISGGRHQAGDHRDIFRGGVGCDAQHPDRVAAHGAARHAPAARDAEPDDCGRAAKPAIWPNATIMDAGSNGWPEGRSGNPVSDPALSQASTRQSSRNRRARFAWFAYSPARPGWLRSPQAFCPARQSPAPAVDRDRTTWSA